MGRGRLLLSLVVAAFVPANAAIGAETRAVVELFTSQGCSSCPAADQLLGELAQDPSIVAMSLPIDYWDYLGWKDTLAKPDHTARQRAYARIRGDRAVYTPQVVVNGAVHVQGSDKAAIARAIAQTRQHAGTVSVPVTLTASGDRINVTVPAARDARTSGEIWLCALTRSVAVAIGRGENRGKSITYYNVVRRWVKIGDWNGAERKWSVPVSDIAADGVDSVAVIIQGGEHAKPGRMIGAAVASIK